MSKQKPADYEAATREVSKGYELSVRLNSMLRGVVPRGDGRWESACRLSKDVQETLASALSILTEKKVVEEVLDPLALEISLPRSESEDTHGDGNQINSRKRSLNSGSTITQETCDESVHCKKNGDQKKICKSKLQRSHLHSWSITTSTPFNDGHQWRKYGEKKISNCKMTRCYYRCTHKDDQGCPATKQVQQKDFEDPPKFVVTYNKQHTCKNLNQLFNEQFVVEPPITDPCQLSL